MFKTVAVGGWAQWRAGGSRCHPHKHPQVREWAADNNVELVFLPTYASWLNWIESEFAALRQFAVNGTDHRSHAEQNAAIAAYIRWHNRHAETQGELRRQLTHPKLDELSGQGCVTRH